MENAVKIKEKLWWTGALDAGLRVFDVVMESPRGTSYNSYVVKGEKGAAVFESVKAPFAEEWVERVLSVVPAEEITAIVCDHTEPDHAGALDALLAVAPNATVYSSRAANGFLKEILNHDFPARIVKQGDELDLGGVTLRFLDAPFLHWPDSIFTYIPELETLISGDVFGYHYGKQAVFAEEDGETAHDREYYFKAIFGPYVQHVLSAVAKVRPLNIETICPSHGPVYNGREAAKQAMDLYENWAGAAVSGREPGSVFVGYVSSYGYTRSLAERIAKGAEEAGHKVYLTDIAADPAAAAVLAEKCGAVAVGSATFNRDALPPAWNMLTAMGSYAWRNRPAVTFGAYAWSGEAALNLQQRLNQLGFKTREPLRVKLKPTEEDLQKAEALGRELL